MRNRKKCICDSAWPKFHIWQAAQCVFEQVTEFMIMKVYDGEPLQVLFKFPCAQATRRISPAQLPFWSQPLFYFKFAV